MPEIVCFVGLPASGKTTMYKTRFAETHVHVSKDNFRSNKDRKGRQAQLIEEAFADGKNVVVDNTNASLEERQQVIDLAKKHGAKLVCYNFMTDVDGCLERNAQRSGKAFVPKVGMLSVAKRLVRPTKDEGFDEMYVVKPIGGTEFSIEIA